MTLQTILDFHKFANQYNVALATLTWTIWMNVESGIQEYSYSKAGQLKGKKFYEIFTVYDRFGYFIDIFDVWNVGFFLLSSRVLTLETHFRATDVWNPVQLTNGTSNCWSPLLSDLSWWTPYLFFIEWNCVEAIYICMCIDLPWWSGYLSGLH